MSLFDRHTERTIKLLDALSKEPLRRKDMVFLWLGTKGTTSSFNDRLSWLKVKGYVRKQDPSTNISPYVITVTGKKYLEGLKA